MKEKFTPYELAIKLKEAGFDEGVFAYFNTTSDTPSELQFPEYGGEVDNWNQTTHIVSAPLWQQAIDWIREKHKLMIDSPKPDQWNQDSWSVRIESMDKTIVLEAYVDQEYWRIYRCHKSYQEAREQSILKALELINKE
jgi:hypothetical protein